MQPMGTPEVEKGGVEGRRWREKERDGILEARRTCGVALFGHLPEHLGGAASAVVRAGDLTRPYNNTFKH